MNTRFEKYFQKQHDLSDCGPACLKMICNYYLQKISLEALREESFITKEGVSLLDLSNAAEKIGFRTFMAYLDLDRLIEDCPFPAILHWNQNHFVVLFRIIKDEKFIIGDSAHGIVTLTKEAFLRSWISTTSERGTVLILEPTSKLGNYKFKDDKLNYIKYLTGYVKPYKKYFLQLILGTLIASGISLILPFATKLLIDEGISKNSNSILLIVFLSQISLLIGSSSIEIIRGWLLLHINTRVSLNIISDFLIKLLRLPIRFFDTKAVGDLSQRINDHHRIDSFLSGTLVSTFFSIINILVFSIILYYFDVRIFLIFALCSSIGIVWVLLFQKKRKSLDYRRFERGRENQDKLYEMIVGMQEIKLYNSETSKRWEWERLQVKFFEYNMSALSLEQLQNNGFNFINTLKNIFISYVAAIYVTQGDFTLGTLLSISYIIGQTNGPIFQILSFIQGIQDAKLSFDRLLEIHKKKDEDNESEVDNSIKSVQVADIILKEISFRYGGVGSPFVLNNINLEIPKGRVTAVVGTSGSGKTTLLKLLLGIYHPTEGQVLIGNQNLHKIKPSLWRALYGTVMQDGFIFHDSITRNVVMDSKILDEEKFERAIRVSKIDEFVDRLPLGYTTKIGSSGIGLSGGQKQRILIGRAIYKDPDYLFFDEATSSLDANNERDIIENLNDFFKSKTVVIIAHRLSTVKNADQIIVLKDGKLIEVGNHATLAARKGEYYNLVHNQLELGV